MFSEDGGTLGTRGAKADICHVHDQNAFQLINVNSNAEPAHRAHGDAAPGEIMPGDPAHKFGADCSLLPANPPPPSPQPGL